jgi:predicted ribosome quality control (RQC) complex YloA/Tae2 family protein
MHTVVQEDNFMGYPLEQIRGKKLEAFIGYLSFNLYDPPKEATWGRYNDRAVNEDWVANLVIEFTKHLDNCTDEDALEVAVKRPWIENTEDILDTVNDKTIKEVPVLKFTREGMNAIHPDNLVMLGGNHRRLALKQYVDELKKQLEKAQQKLKGKDTQAQKHADITGPIADEVKRLQETVDWYDRKVKKSQHWVVALYDIGTQ